MTPPIILLTNYFVKIPLKQNVTLLQCKKSIHVLKNILFRKTFWLDAH